MKKIIVIASMLCMILAAGLFFVQSKSEVTPSDLLNDNVEALADINPFCPNGCEADGVECFCYMIHQGHKEHVW